jgi:hypothetical protein
VCGDTGWGLGGDTNWEESQGLIPSTKPSFSKSCTFSCQWLPSAAPQRAGGQHRSGWRGAGPAGATVRTRQPRQPPPSKDAEPLLLQ